jgi:hypothetical protein
MRSPSIVPGFDVDVCIVLDDFGQNGRAYRETDESQADKETLIRDLISGQYNNPVRIVCFNTAEGTLPGAERQRELEAFAMTLPACFSLDQLDQRRLVWVRSRRLSFQRYSPHFFPRGI